MQTTAAASTVSIPVPDIDSDEPIAITPLASVAPLDGPPDGPPDGERINTFALVPKNGDPAIVHSSVNTSGNLRASVLRKPLTYVAAMLSIGFLLGRMLR